MTFLGKKLISAAKSARKIARGEADPKTYRVHLPETIDVAAIRKATGYPQDEFSARFGIPLGTLRDWEQKRKAPDTTARVLLVAIRNNHKAVLKALHRKSA